MERDRGLAWLCGLSLGAAFMYFLDPRSGRRRRARARDTGVHATNACEDAAERLARDVANRTRGTIARTRRRLVSEGLVDDERLVARVRSALGRLCSHPGPVKVEAAEGVVTLRGPILAGEAALVAAGVRGVPGVKRVESLLWSVTDPSQVPALQGVRPAVGMPPDLLQRKMSPTSRLLAGTVGGMLVWAGARRGDALGVAGATLGGFLFARAATNMEPERLLTAGVRDSIPVQKTVTIMAPLQEVFAFWSSFRNFPRFMEHLREVSENEEGISHWVADGPAGIPVSWDAEITALQPYKRIAWRSKEGSTVQNEGEVCFEEVDERNTRIHVRMRYHPPGGSLGYAVAAFFGADPTRQLADDLNRFKRLLEDGSVTAHGQSVARQDLQVTGP